MLDNPNEPVSDLSYFDCIESVMENSKVSLALLYHLRFFTVAHGLFSCGGQSQQLLCTGLAAPWPAGPYFPNQLSNPYPLHCKVDS